MILKDNAPTASKFKGKRRNCSKLDTRQHSANHMFQMKEVRLPATFSRGVTYEVLFVKIDKKIKLK
jgi:hypothetical protein